MSRASRSGVQVSVAENGTMMYRTGEAPGPASTIELLGRDGSRTPLDEDPKSYGDVPRLFRLDGDTPWGYAAPDTRMGYPADPAGPSAPTAKGSAADAFTGGSSAMAKKRQTKKRSAVKKSRPSAGGERGLADRLAAGIDPAAKAAILTRLRRAKGQAAGIERMIENERECAEIITQIIAARASLMAVAKALLEDHMKRSHILAAQNGEVEMDDMYQHLVDLLTKMAR